MGGGVTRRRTCSTIIFRKQHRQIIIIKSFVISYFSLFFSFICGHSATSEQCHTAGVTLRSAITLLIYNYILKYIFFYYYLFRMVGAPVSRAVIYAIIHVKHIHILPFGACKWKCPGCVCE